MDSSAQGALRAHVVWLLEGGGAHLDFDDAVARLPAKLRGARPTDLPHTPWRLVEHMRLCQRDILEYTRDAAWESPPWPAGYWPDGDAPPSAKAWERSVQAFRDDRSAMVALIEDERTDLLTPMPWAEDGHTPLREALLVADHNSYHIGQLVTVRRLLGAWSG